MVVIINGKNHRKTKDCQLLFASNIEHRIFTDKNMHRNQ